MLALCIDPVGSLERKLYYIYQANPIDGNNMVYVFTIAEKQIKSTVSHGSWMAKRFKILNRTSLIGV